MARYEYSLATGITTEHPDLPAAPVVVVAPRTVSMRQARRALLAAGLLAHVDVALRALPDGQREAALIDWEYATTLNRDDPLVYALSAVLKLDEVMLDDLFLAAEST